VAARHLRYARTEPYIDAVLSAESSGAMIDADDGAHHTSVAEPCQFSVVLLVSWVVAAALMHGIGQISTAFMVRRVGKALAD
jgi:hypothetical protein